MKQELRRVTNNNTTNMCSICDASVHFSSKKLRCNSELTYSFNPLQTSASFQIIITNVEEQGQQRSNRNKHPGIHDANNQNDCNHYQSSLTQSQYSAWLVQRTSQQQFTKRQVKQFGAQPNKTYFKLKHIHEQADSVPKLTVDRNNIFLS